MNSEELNALANEMDYQAIADAADELPELYQHHVNAARVIRALAKLDGDKGGWYWCEGKQRLYAYHTSGYDTLLEYIEDAK